MRMFQESIEAACRRPKTCDRKLPSRSGPRALPVRRLSLYASLAVFLAGTISGPAFAQNQPPARPGKRRAAIAADPGFISDLTVDQRQRVQSLRVELYDQLSPLRRQLLVLRGDLERLWSSNEPQRAALVGKLTEMASLWQKIETARVDHHLAVLALLTPVQRRGYRERMRPMLGPGRGLQMGMRRGMERGGMPGARGPCWDPDFD